MEVSIECPVCESEFQTRHPKPESVLCCPSCDRKFNYVPQHSQAQRKARSNSSTAKPKQSSERGRPNRNPTLATPPPPGVPLPAPSKSAAELPAGEPTSVDLAPVTNNGQQAGATAVRDLSPPHASATDSLETIPLAKPVVTPAAASEAIPIASVADQPDGPKSASLVAVRQRYQKRNRHRAILTITLAALFALLIVGLTAWFVIQLNGPELFASGTPAVDSDEVGQVASDSDERPVATPQNSSVTVDDRDSLQTTPGDQASKRTATSPAQTVTSSQSAKSARTAKRSKPQKIEFAKLPQPRLELLSLEQLDDTWRIARPRLVSLRVHRDNQSTAAVGTIVDSRGWVLTSRQAIEGARRIEVIASAKIIDDLYEADLLRDEVRGIIASSPEHDLAILAVNRRFVQSFGALGYGTRRDVVRGQFVVQAAPPSSTNPYARVEVEVTNRMSFAELPPAVKREADSRGINEPNNTWIEVTLEADPQPGTPLFTRDGHLVGFHSFNTEGRAYFLLVDHLQSTLDQAEDSPQPLISIATATQRQANQAQQEINLVADDAVRLASMNLDQVAAKCEAFDWIPTTQPQYQLLQSFAANMTEVLTYVSLNRNNEDEKAAVDRLSKQTDKWRQSISRAISNRNPKQLKDSETMAQLAVDQLSENKLSGDQRMIPFFGRVHIAGIVSPDPEAMFLAVGRNQAFFRVPYQQTGRALLPGSEWLFFVAREEASTISSHRHAGSTFKAHRGRLMFVIGPLPSTF